jgi:hypothetical protein
VVLSFTLPSTGAAHTYVPDTTGPDAEATPLVANPAPRAPIVPMLPAKSDTPTAPLTIFSHPVPIG